MNQSSPEPIARALRALYKAQQVLHEAFPLWPFTLDGKLIGDIGEVIAAKVFGLTRLSEGTKAHDLRAPNRKLVQVKATQKGPPGKAVGLGLKKTNFAHLLVLEFDKDGTFEVLFNGPGRYIENKRKHRKSASLSRKQLRECQLLVPMAQQLKAVI